MSKVRRPTDLRYHAVVRSRCGVTLIETLMVIALLAASATIGAWKVRQNHGVSGNLRHTANMIAAHFESSRHHAMDHQCDVVVQRREIRRIDAQNQTVFETELGFTPGGGPLGGGAATTWVRTLDNNRIRGPARFTIFADGTLRSPVQWSVRRNPDVGMEATVAFHPVHGTTTVTLP